MGPKSLYAQYMEEREQKQVLEKPNGFAVYWFYQEWCYIEDIYVVPADRQSKVATEMANEITTIALGRGYKKLLGSVKPSAINSTKSLQVLLAYGFKLLSSDSNSILLEKQIGV